MKVKLHFLRVKKVVCLLCIMIVDRFTIVATFAIVNTLTLSAR